MTTHKDMPYVVDGSSRRSALNDEARGAHFAINVEAVGFGAVGSVCVFSSAMHHAVSFHNVHVVNVPATYPAGPPKPHFGAGSAHFNYEVIELVDHEKFGWDCIRGSEPSGDDVGPVWTGNLLAHSIDAAVTDAIPEPLAPEAGDDGSDDFSDEDEGNFEFSPEDDVLSAPGVAEAIEDAFADFEKWKDSL